MCQQRAYKPPVGLSARDEPPGIEAARGNKRSSLQMDVMSHAEYLKAISCTVMGIGEQIYEPGADKRACGINFEWRGVLRLGAWRRHKCIRRGKEDGGFLHEACWSMAHMMHQLTDDAVLSQIYQSQFVVHNHLSIRQAGSRYCQRRSCSARSGLCSDPNCYGYRAKC